MILTFLPWFLNHLWQSTLCGGIAVLLAFALRRNSAAVRYRIWFAASLKFLIPFSVLVSLGGRMDWRPDVPAAVVRSSTEASTPSETSRMSSMIDLAAPITAPVPRLTAQTPTPFRISTVLLIVWFGGFLLSAIAWLREWLNVRAKVRAATPLEWDLPVRIPVMSSPASIEPSVFGIFRPILLLPAGIHDELPPAQMETILLHESFHVRRRDNLAAALHMIVETVFWFHPLVWWIGNRMVEERERACDEAVLGGSSQSEVYAEAILKVCKLHLKTPLACMAGVASSNLRQRIEEIMNYRNPWKLQFSRKLMLALTGAVILGGPIFVGMVNARQLPATAAIAASSSNFSTIDVPGSSSTVARSINGLGRIVGSYVNESGTHGFLLANGTFTTIDVPGSAWTIATGINSVGQIVGSYGQGGPSGNHGFLFSGGAFSSFDFPGGLDTIANGLSNNGQIVGSYLGNDGSRHGFRLSGGTYSIVEFPESRAGSAEGINDSGQIVGLSGYGATAFGFLYSGGTYSKVQFTRDAFAVARGVNNLGDIVGQDGVPQGAFRGFVRNGEKYSLVDVPGLPFSFNGMGINDLGQIVGEYTDSAGKTHGYLATPTAFQVPPDNGDPQLPRLLSDASGPGLRGPVGPEGPMGPPGPPGPPGPGRGRGGNRGANNGRDLNATRNALQRTLNTLERVGANNEYAQRALAQVGAAINDVTAAMTYIKDNPEAAAAPAIPPAVRIDFNPPATEIGRYPGREIALNNLSAAFDAFVQAPGGDLGGLRGKIYAEIDAAAKEVVADIITAGLHDRDRRGRGGAPATLTVTPEGR